MSDMAEGCVEQIFKKKGHGEGDINSRDDDTTRRVETGKIGEVESNIINGAERLFCFR